MGCGHSKINIYPRKHKNKTNDKKSVTPENSEVEEDANENELELDHIEACDARKIKVKSSGGPLLAQAEVSSSQQEFFKMLEEKIQNGPDYNSDSETETTAEASRLSALLKDWETASAGSRSLPATPQRKPASTEKIIAEGVRFIEVCEDGLRPSEITSISQISQNMIRQPHCLTQASYRQLHYNNPTYISHNMCHQIPYATATMQSIDSIYTNQPVYQLTPQRQYSNYNQHGGSMKTCRNNSPKHTPYDQLTSSCPSHKLYGSPIPGVKTIYSNGELFPQQFYNQMQYQKYKETGNQIIVENSQSAGYRIQRNDQTTGTIPIVVKNQQNEINTLHCKQYEIT